MPTHGQILAMTDQVLPNSPEAETAVLGAIVRVPDLIPDIRQRLCDDDFYSAANAAVYRAMLAEFDATGDITVAGMNLNLRGLDIGVDVDEFIHRLIDYPASSGSAPYWVRSLHGLGRLRRMIASCSRTMFDAYQATEHDADSLSASLASDITREIDDVVVSDTEGGDAAQLVLDSLDRGNSGLLTTGLGKLDSQCGGIPEVGVTVVLGVPGSGKSSIAAGIVRHLLLDKDKGVGVFSYEMDAQAYTRMILQQATGLPLSRMQMRGQRPTTEEHQGLTSIREVLKASTLFFAEDNLNAEQMLTRAAAWKRKGVSVIVNDYIQNNPPISEGDGEYQTVTRGMGYMRRIARELGMAVIVVAQPTIGAARLDRPLKAADCKGSGAIWEAADTILSVYRQCVGHPREADESDHDWESRVSNMEVHVVKNKSLGLVGLIRATFNPDTTLVSG